MPNGRKQSDWLWNRRRESARWRRGVWEAIEWNVAEDEGEDGGAIVGEAGVAKEVISEI
jgi:hypothetical protein